MLLSTQITTATSLSAHLLILLVGCVLSACASRNSAIQLADGDRVLDGAMRTPAVPRLRRESISRMPSTRTFGNLAIESLVDAPCGYRDEHAAVVCLNVAGDLNAGDAALVQAQVQRGASIRVHDAKAREQMENVRADAAGAQVPPAINVQASSDCRGACVGRIELVHPR